MPAKKRARSRPSRTTPPKSRTLRVRGGVSVQVTKTSSGADLTINGQVISATKLQDGSYYSDFAPQQSFPSIDALVRALVGDGAESAGAGSSRPRRGSRAQGRAATVKATDDGPTTKVTDDVPTIKTTDEIKLKFADDTGRFGDLPSTKAQDDFPPPTIKFQEDPPPSIKFQEDQPPTLKIREDQPPPTLKFQEDPPTLKFQEDFPPPTLKFREDLPPPTLKLQEDQTLKLRDDLPTIKIRDDLPKLKFQDDPGTLKFRDESPTAKFLDDPMPTIKFRDDPTVKLADDGGGSTTKMVDDGTLKFREDVAGPKGPGDVMGPAGGETRTIRSAAPFVLSTPHHSRVWAESFPDAFAQAVAQYEATIVEYEQVLQAPGRMSPTEAAGLLEEYQQLLNEYRELTEGPTG